MHYPGQGSIIPVLMAGAWLTAVRWCVISCPRCRSEAQFSQPHRLICSGENGRSAEQMKWDYEDEGTRWLNMCVNGAVDFGFFLPYFSSDDIWLRLFPWTSALLPHASWRTRWQQHLQIHLMLCPPISRKFRMCVVAFPTPPWKGPQLFTVAHQVWRQTQLCLFFSFTPAHASFSRVFIQLRSQLQIERRGKEKEGAPPPMGGSETLPRYNVECRRQALAVGKNTIKISVAAIVPHIMCPRTLSISVFVRY